MIKVSIFRKKDKNSNTDDYQQIHNDASFDYIFGDVQNKSIDNPNNPFKDIQARYNTEDFLKEQYPNYTWQECRWLRFFKINGTAGYFYGTDKEWDIKMIKVEDWNVSWYQGKKKWMRTSLTRYYRVEYPQVISSQNADELAFLFECTYDSFFSEWWIYLLACENVNPTVIFKEKELTLGDVGKDFEVSQNLVDWNMFPNNMTAYRIPTIAGYTFTPEDYKPFFQSLLNVYVKYRPEHTGNLLATDEFYKVVNFNDGLGSMNLPLTYTTFKQIVQFFLDRWSISIPGGANTMNIFNIVDSDVLPNSKYYILNNGKNRHLNVVKTPYYQVENIKAPYFILSDKDDLNVSQGRIWWTNNFIPPRLVSNDDSKPNITTQQIPAQIMSNLSIPSVKSFETSASAVGVTNINTPLSYLYTTPNGNINKTKYVLNGQYFNNNDIFTDVYKSFIDVTFKVSEEKELYVYLILNSGAWNNVADINEIIDSAMTSSYWTTTIKKPSANPADTTGETVRKQMGTENCSIVIPVPRSAINVERFNNSTGFRIATGNIISYLQSKVMLQTITVGEQVYSLTNGSVASNIKGIWITDKAPSTLSSLAISQTDSNSNNTFNCGKVNITVGTDQTQVAPSNWVDLLFAINDDSSQTTIDDFFSLSAIIIPDISIYEVFESSKTKESVSAFAGNAQSNFYKKEYTGYFLEFFNKIDRFANGDFTHWTIDTEPSLLSPSILSAKSALSLKQSMDISLADIDFSEFLTKEWSVGLSYTFVGSDGSGVAHKLELNQLINTDKLYTTFREEMAYTDPHYLPYETSSYAETAKQKQIANNQGFNVANQRYDFNKEWTKKENDARMAGAIIGGIGDTIGGAVSGAKNGGGIIGAIGGGISGAAKGIANGIVTAMENENRMAALDANWKLQKQEMRAGVMSLQDAGASSHVENAALYAFMELNQFNENVISKTNGYKRYRTQELIKEQQETILYQAKLWGRYYPYKGRFNDYKMFSVCNYFSLDGQKTLTVEFLKQIHDWIEEHLKDEYRFAQVFSESNLNIFIQKLSTGIRLWDTQKISYDFLENKAELYALSKITPNLHPADDYRFGRPRTIMYYSRYSKTPRLKKYWWQN